MPFILAALVFAAPQQLPLDIDLHPLFQNEACVWQYEEELLDELMLRNKAKAWAEQGKSVAIVMKDDTPTGCAVMGLMFVRDSGVEVVAAVPEGGPVDQEESEAGDMQ